MSAITTQPRRASSKHLRTQRAVPRLPRPHGRPTALVSALGVLADRASDLEMQHLKTKRRGPPKRTKSLFKSYSDAIISLPYNAAQQLQPFVRHDQCEFIRNADQVGKL